MLQGRQGPEDVFDDDYTYEVDDTEDYYFSNAAGVSGALSALQGSFLVYCVKCRTANSKEMTRM